MNSKSTYIAFVMQGLDCLSLDQARMVNEELGSRHRGRDGKVECSICGAECESVVHVLCVQHISRVEKPFKAKFKELIGDSFEQLSDIDKTAYVLGSELWEENFEDMLRP